MNSKPAQLNIGLALGGGMAYALAHIGVLKVLDEEGIRISRIAATSAGSIVGSLYSSGRSGRDLEEITRKINLKDFFNIALTGQGFANSSPMAAFVEKYTGVKNIQDLNIPLTIVATELVTGKKVVFDKGPLGLLVRATSAVPGFFPPIPYEGMLLVDGGITENVPVETLRERKCDLILGSNVLAEVQNEKGLTTIQDIILHTLHILLSKWAKEIEIHADLIFYPIFENIQPHDVHKVATLIAAGEKAARDVLPLLKNKIEIKMRGVQEP